MLEANLRTSARGRVDMRLKARHDGKHFDVHLINAGIGGGFAKTGKKLEIGSVIELRYGKKKDQFFQARVMHRQENGIGVKFIDPPAEFLNQVPTATDWVRFLEENPDYQKTVPWALAFSAPLYYLAKAYFNLEVRGIDNIPYGSRFVWTQNHSGWIAFDAPLIGHVIARNNPVEKFEWSQQKMGWGFFIKNIFSGDVGDWGVNFWNNFAYHLPVLSSLLKAFHGLPVDAMKSPGRLKNYRLYATPAEGEEGACKSSFTQLYKLQRFRTGVARLALSAEVDYILPIAIVGPEESFLNLGSLRIFKKFLGTILPMPLLNFPLPVKWVVSFLKPIDIRPYISRYQKAHDSQKTAICKEIMDRVHEAIEQDLKRELEDRVPYWPWFIKKLPSLVGFLSRNGHLKF